MQWQTYIYTNPEILRGKPIIKGTRLSVEFILSLYENRWTETMILENYPALNPEILSAVFAYLREGLFDVFLYPITQKAA
jgi:uncharacterized protein (DUF433 family)